MEDSARASHPKPYAGDRGADRFIERVAEDGVLRAAAVAAASLAAFAGAGFGRLFAHAPVDAALILLAGPGLAIAALPPRKDRLATRFAAPFKIMRGVVCVAAIPGFAFLAAQLGVSPIAAGAVALVLAVRHRREPRPVVFLAELAVVAWVLARVPSVFLIGAVAAALLGLALLSVRRPRFAAIAVPVVALHLAGAPHASVGLYDGLPLHLVAATVSFAFLVIAGFRFALAALDLSPRATYRAAPECLVPRLDRAWDFPLRIDVR